MAVDPVELRTNYLAIEAHLDVLLGDVCEWLKATVENLGLLDARVDGRVKKPYSFVNKSLKKELEGDGWADPLTEASDKVGIRADVLLLEHAELLCGAIESATDVFDSITRDDKSDALGVDRLGYHGVHFDVVPNALPDGLLRGHATCEIQVRTHAQAAWAMAVHEVVYKAPVEVPIDVERSINRLTALLELFDEGVKDARGRIVSTDGYPLAILVNALESKRMRFTAEAHDRELTQRLVAVVARVDTAEEAQDLVGKIEAFVDENESKLQGIYDARLATGDATLIIQPEAILLFFFLDEDRFTLQTLWINQEWSYGYLEHLATVWGAPLPVPT